MKFVTERIVTGIVPRISKKTGNSYMLINYLNDEGTTFSSMANESLAIPTDVKQMSRVKVEFEVSFYNGNVNGLRTNSLDIVK